jgi:hypothetical protein
MSRKASTVSPETTLRLKNKWLDRKQNKIVVIGAGAAGLTGSARARAGGEKGNDSGSTGQM